MGSSESDPSWRGAQRPRVAADGHLVLGDCGLAFELEHETRQTRPFENVGSRDFQPPWSYTTRLAEVLPTFDVFCLAKVLWAMVSGRPTFRLWYFDEDGNDLREMFPDDPAMEFVQEILRKCVVEREREMKVHDARELLAEVDTAIAALSHGCELPGQGRIMRCRFCGIGTCETLEGHLVAGGLRYASQWAAWGAWCAARRAKSIWAKLA